ncbi:MAG: 23S rRNA (guanosine(2251)-2'-O)-methyltransferase RlmB [Bacteroidota bacterium]|nr:23S rRNA (guanosine(2251)-2'-O)-methyltransferase RlmB [Bacteroidota bacterium]
MKKKDFIFGLRPLIEAINAGKEVEKVLIQKGLKGELHGELHDLLRKHNVPFQYVPGITLKKYTQANHQGVVAFLSLITYQNIEDIIPMLYEDGKTPFVLVLDRLTDVRNFGAIVRTAECAGVHAIIIPSRGAAQVNADAIKTSAGALHNVPLYRSDDLPKTVKFLQQSGLKVVAATEKSANDYTTIDYTAPTAFIMGSEEDGVSNDLLKISDHRAIIPLQGTIGSLNVSVATGVILYEALRQRNK